MIEALEPPQVPKAAVKRKPSTRKLEALVADLRQERMGLIERCAIAEKAALQNLQYAQAARSAMEEGIESILKKLDTMSKPLIKE